MRTKPSTLAVLVAVVVALVQIVGTIGAAAGQSDRHDIDLIAVALVLIGAAALVWREQHPVAVGVITAGVVTVYIAAGYAYGPVFLCFAVALFGVVQSGRRMASIALATIFLAGFTVALAIDDDSPLPTLVHLALVSGWMTVVIAVSEVIRVRRDQVAAARRAARDDERRRADELRVRIAQDVHDVLAHNLSMINVQAGVALHLLDDHPDQARPALATIKAASRDALGELRHALDVLRTGEAAPRGPLPGIADLPTLVAGVRGSGLDVTLDVTLDAREPSGTVSATVGHAVYRVVQESLTNIARHAGADRVTVRVQSGDEVTVEVVDDGRGGPFVEGNGIAGMRGRVDAAGGTLQIGPGDAGGMHIIATFPGTSR